jgi:hypothetical protein
MRNWSPARLLTVLAVAALAAMEPVSWITAQVPPCLVDPAGYATEVGPRSVCPTLRVFLVRQAAALIDLLADPPRITALFAVILAVSTFLGWLSMRKLAGAAMQAAHAASTSANALMAAEQAQLLTMFDVGNIPQVLSGELARPDHADPARTPTGERILIKLVCKNYGKSMAIIREISRELEHRKSPPASLRYVPMPNLPRERAVLAGATSEPVECIMAAPLTAAEITSVRAGDSFLWLCGRVLYDDAFGREREHRFLYRYRVGYGFQPYYYKDYHKNT